MLTGFFCVEMRFFFLRPVIRIAGSCAMNNKKTLPSKLLLLSALQLFVSFGLLNYSFPLLPLLCSLFPIDHSHLPQIIPHIVFPSCSWSYLRSFCIRYPFVYGLGHSFISHSFYMPQPAQYFIFYVP